MVCRYLRYLATQGLIRSDFNQSRLILERGHMRVGMWGDLVRNRYMLLAHKVDVKLFIAQIIRLYPMGMGNKRRKPFPLRYAS